MLPFKLAELCRIVLVLSMERSFVDLEKIDEYCIMAKKVHAVEFQLLFQTFW